HVRPRERAVLGALTARSPTAAGAHVGRAGAACAARPARGHRAATGRGLSAGQVSLLAARGAPLGRGERSYVLAPRPQDPRGEALLARTDLGQRRLAGLARD